MILFVTAMLACLTRSNLYIVLATAILGAQAGSAERDYARGVELQQAGKLEAARDAYEAALRISPQRIDALSNLGLVYAGLKDYGRSIDRFEKALRLAPGHPVVLFNLGITYLQSGRDEQARGALSQVVAAQGTNEAARQYLALALLRLGRVREGIAELERVHAAQPGNLDAACTLASAYIKGNELAKARSLIGTIRTTSDGAEAHLLVGSFLMATQQYKEALAELRRAQQINPSLPEVRSSLAMGYVMTGSRELAIQAFEANLRAHPQDFETLALLGWLYLEGGRASDAAPVLERAEKARPGDPDVLFQLARLARDNRDFAKAASLLERVVARRPDHTQAHVLLAQTYFRLNRREEGRRERKIADELTERDRARTLDRTAVPGREQ